MADTLSTTSTLNNLLSTYLEKKALPRLVARTVLWDFADKKPLPTGAGATTVRWNGYSNFSPVTGSLGEGTPADLKGLTSRKVEATIAQYGRGVKPTDLILATSSLDLIAETAMNLGDSAGLSVDRVLHTAIFKDTMGQNIGTKILSLCMSAQASAFFAGAIPNSGEDWNFPVIFGTTAAKLSCVSKDAPSVSACASIYAIRKAVKALKWQNALPYADGFYKLVANSDFLTDIERDPTFVNWYSNSQQIDAMEKGVAYRGRTKECKVYESNNLPYYRATGHSCDLTFIFGQGAYGCTYIGASKGFEIIVKRPNEYDKSDPFNQYMTMTYKITMAVAPLNPSAGRVLITHKVA